MQWQVGDRVRLSKKTYHNLSQHLRSRYEMTAQQIADQIGFVGTVTGHRQVWQCNPDMETEWLVPGVLVVWDGAGIYEAAYAEDELRRAK